MLMLRVSVTWLSLPPYCVPWVSCRDPPVSSCLQGETRSKRQLPLSWLREQMELCCRVCWCGLVVPTPLFDLVAFACCAQILNKMVSASLTISCEKPRPYATLNGVMPPAPRASLVTQNPEHITCSRALFGETAKLNATLRIAGDTSVQRIM